ncbi:hypothetical protein Q5752_003677 [Cryptotrichosporon argae]
MLPSSDENAPPAPSPSPSPPDALRLAPLDATATPARKLLATPHAAPTLAAETPRRPLGALTNAHAHAYTAPRERAKPSPPASMRSMHASPRPHLHGHAHAHLHPYLHAHGRAPQRHGHDLPSIRQMGLAGVGVGAVGTGVPARPFTFTAHPSPSPFPRPLDVPSTPARPFSPASSTPFSAHMPMPTPAATAAGGERRTIDLRGLHGPAAWQGAYPYDFSAKRPPPPEPGKGGRPKDKKKQSAAPSINPWDYVAAQADSHGRRRFPRHEIDVMELMWSDQMSPCKWTRMRMARWFGCRTHHVTVWFQNRRQELKKAQNGVAQAEETMASAAKSEAEKAVAQAELEKCQRQIDVFGSAHTRIDDWQARREAVFAITSMDQPDFDRVNAADVASPGATPSPPTTMTGSAARAKRPRHAVTMDDVCNDREQSMLRQPPAARTLAPLPLRSLRDMDAADPAYNSILLGKMSSDLPSEPAEPDADAAHDDDGTDATDAGTDAGTDRGAATDGDGDDVDADVRERDADGADGSPRRRTRRRLPPCSELAPPRSRLPGIHVPKSKFGRTSSADLFWHSTRARQLYAGSGAGAGASSGSRTPSHATPLSASSSASSHGSTGPLRAVAPSYGGVPATPAASLYYGTSVHTPGHTPAAAAVLTPRAIPPAMPLKYHPKIQHRDSFSRSQSGPADLAGRARAGRDSDMADHDHDHDHEPEPEHEHAHTSSDTADPVLQTPAHALAGPAARLAAPSSSPASSDLAHTPPDLGVRGKLGAMATLAPLAPLVPLAPMPFLGARAVVHDRGLARTEGRTIYTPKKEDEQDLAAAEALMGMGKNGA